MNYAARHLSPGVNDSGVLRGMEKLPWETELEQGTARQETWLLSFIDILALLLTLFVLLLAFQDQEQAEIAAEATGAGLVSPSFFNLLAISPEQGQLRFPDTEAGFAMPGEGLVPMDVGRKDEGSATGGIQSAQTTQERADVRQPAQPVAILADQTEEAAPAAEEQREYTRDSESLKDAVTVASTQQPNVDAAAVETPQPDTADAATVQAEHPASDTPARQDSSARQAADALLLSLHESALADGVEVITRPGAVNLEIRDNILFAPASAALSPEGEALLAQLAAILQTLPYSVSVEGHTDNVPINTPLYPSNWELSSARAARVTRMLVERGVAQERLRTVGYGDTRPRGDNATVEARAENRRVTFVLQVEDAR